MLLSLATQMSIIEHQLYHFIPIILTYQIGTLTAEFINLKQSTESFSDTFISETAMLKSNIEAVIEQLVGLDEIKDQHIETK